MSKFKITKTKLAVGVFLMFAVWIADYARGDTDVYLGLGHTMFNSSATMHQLTIRNGNYDTQFRMIGAGDTRNGYQQTTYSASFSRVWRGPTYKGVTIKGRLGLAYTPGSQLIGNTNFRLGIIFSMFDDLLEIEAISHDSSANLWNPNTGLDAVILNLGVNF